MGPEPGTPMRTCAGTGSVFCSPTHQHGRLEPWMALQGGTVPTGTVSQCTRQAQERAAAGAGTAHEVLHRPRGEVLHSKIATQIKS